MLELKAKSLQLRDPSWSLGVQKEQSTQRNIQQCRLLQHE